MKILFAAFEASPFVQAGGLGDVAGSLPKALAALGHDVRLILPLHEQVAADVRAAMRPVCYGKVRLGWREQYCGILEYMAGPVTVYFVDNEYYFKRNPIYGYMDDGERAAFFCRAVTENLRELWMLDGFQPDVIHCNDWHASLIPVFLRENYDARESFYPPIRTVLTIHNLQHQGKCNRECLTDMLDLPAHGLAAERLSFDQDLDFLKGGLLYSDQLTTVSPTYAREIQTPYYGEGLDEILRWRSGDLTGILNGIDGEEYHPQHDPFLPCPIGPDLAGKGENKRLLQQELGLPVDPNCPLLIMVSRLVEQKGLDLLNHILAELLCCPVQLAVLGTGEARYEAMFQEMVRRFPDRFALRLEFSRALAHRFYAGGDLLLFPSKFEPCGLTQMIAMTYGTLPLVRETGGLADSVRGYKAFGKEADGFSFPNYNAHELLFTVKEAIGLYRDNRQVWMQLQQNAYTRDFSWQRSAEQYVQVYERACRHE